jgi:hypothetical protein
MWDSRARQGEAPATRTRGREAEARAACRDEEDIRDLSRVEMPAGALSALRRIDGQRKSCGVPRLITGQPHDCPGDIGGLDYPP